jgi:citrate/tricarballylate utilization protein
LALPHGGSSHAVCFLADFLSTTLAFFYQALLHHLPPYPLTSLPVIVGSVGGLFLIIGTFGLTWLKWKSDRAPGTAPAYGMDDSFLMTLGLVALTGMLTLIFRATPALGGLLVLHLALIAALFITAPYGKFVHALPLAGPGALLGRTRSGIKGETWWPS